MTVLSLLIWILQALKHEDITSINMDTISGLADTFSMHPEEYVPWLVECCNASDLSKTLFFLVLLQSFTRLKIGVISWQQCYTIILLSNLCAISLGESVLVYTILKININNIVSLAVVFF